VQLAGICNHNPHISKPRSEVRILWGAPINEVIDYNGRQLNNFKRS